MDFAVFWQLLLSGMTAGCVYAMVALGFVLCMHVSGVINFAQGEYAMAGGVGASVLSAMGIPLFGAVLCAAIIGGALGALQERLTLLPARKLSIFIRVTITFGFAGIVRSIAMAVGGKDALSLQGLSGDGAFQLFGAILPTQTLWIFGATVLMLGMTFWFLHRTTPGRAVRACAENPVAARLMGINVSRLSLIVFVASGAVGALAGAVTAPVTGAYWLSGLDTSLKGFVGAIIADLKSPQIAVAGGLAIGIVESLSAGFISSAYKDVIVYAVLLAYLLVKGGLFMSERALTSNQAS